ncbi:MAG: signal peptidase I [Spirochaetes bacterium]|nr:signal peptidase I [Spirochaetota bacterium]
MYRQESQLSGILVKIISAAGGIIAGFIICRLIILPFQAPDDSMGPAVKAGDTLFFLKHATLKVEDIVLIESPVEPGRYVIRRIIAGEGDAVEIKDRVFYINNARASFRWKTVSSDTRIFPMNFTYRDNMPAVKLGRKEYFVLSDNLDRGFDSRTLGVIPSDLIIGKMVYSY